jgi:uncharacterized protein (TIGR04255 family)
MLPKAERVLFKDAPVRLVIGQIRFPLLLKYAEGTFIAPFQEAISDEYPSVARESQVSIQVSPKGVAQSPGDTLLRFSSRDSLWSVVLAEGALTLEVRGYSAIEEFTRRFTKVLQAASDHLKIRERTRLGLRYINEIRHPGGQTLADWRRLLNPELVGFAGGELLGGQVEHMAQEIQARRPDGTLAIRHGVLTGRVVDPLPQTDAPDGRFYLLDMDYYDARPEPLDIKRTTTQVRTYNDVMYRFFRWSLSKELYNYLKPEPVHE